MNLVVRYTGGGVGYAPGFGGLELNLCSDYHSSSVSVCMWMPTQEIVYSPLMN